ncbi:hypothetical protein NLI96_g790 [Meripilus lineatus]|uniref:NADP-dependent oxidoreductase domain-containing protein n=1 Tax=Meripilus lineatus TaxID=2056292 RepID=A0AAD5YNH0_9APHY|nr:hypothetical protein NLI96_g790 [Physisporinus lineatus]
MSAPNVPVITLNNGVSIPALGLGTWQSKPEDVVNAVEYAIKEAGYRHIDGAWMYGNEKEVGEGIRRSGVPRSEIFITSKLWCTRHHEVEKALDESLASFGTDYLDRKVRAIGVSNFSQKKLEEILPTATIVPAVNQLELHLYNPQADLIDYLRSKQITPQAYSPLGSTNSPLLTDESVTNLAQKYKLQAADILLGYLLKKGIVVLPKSVTPSRISSNITGAVAAVGSLTEEDVAQLDKVAPGGKQKRFIRPPWGVDLGFSDWNA